MGPIFLFLAIVLSSAIASAECSMSANCGFNVAVSVDLNSKCMCVKGNCFLINIGKNGPSMTTGGSGQLKEAKGAKYQTKPGPGSTSYDNDAISTGIPGNDNVGKWIHKTQGCSPGGSNATKGCIAVPCDKWPEVKQQMGQPLMICGGSSGPGSSGGGGGGSKGRGGKR